MQDWHELTEGLLREPPSHPLWRRYCDGLHGRLLDRWLGPRRFGRGLKTDLFEEAFGSGLVGALRDRCDSVHGIDVAPPIVAAAARRHPGLRAEVGDVRNAPGLFDLVVSTSTLDHFESEEELEEGLDGLVAAVGAGGELVVTLDNADNPLLRWRNRNQPALRRGGVLPYPVGRTLGAAGLERALRRRGLQVRAVRPLMLPLRVAALRLCPAVDGLGLGEPFLAGLWACERGAALPGAGRVAWFVAAHAVRAA